MSKAKHVDIEKVRAEYREGKSLRELAQENGVSHVHIGRLLKGVGEAMRVPRSLEIRQRMVEAKQIKAIVQQRAAVVLYTQGSMKVPEIASALGRTYDWVTRKLKEEGVFV